MTPLSEHPDWPAFRWNAARLGERLAAVRYKQGRTIGRMQALGLSLCVQATLQILTEEVCKSSEIAGQWLDREKVHRSIGRRLGLECHSDGPIDSPIEGAVEIIFDATQHYAEPFDVRRLCAWHATLLTAQSAGMSEHTVAMRYAETSAPTGISDFETALTARARKELRALTHWFENTAITIDPVIRAGVAHFWFMAISPFEEGNGRIARALTQLALARSEEIAPRFYSLSAKIQREPRAYHDALSAHPNGSLDITAWLEWFLDCLEGAIGDAETILASVLQSARLREALAGESFNDRQRAFVHRLLEGGAPHLTTSHWAMFAACSQDTALRDIGDLVRRGILVRDTAGGRSTRYSLCKI